MKDQWDIIGDTHGRARELEDVLAQLGFEEGPLGYTHPQGRKILFAGDFIDKGPDNRRVLQIVRTMVVNGNATAIMGNHEFNAICYATPDGKGGWLRAHSARNEHQHGGFLAEFPFGSPDYEDTIAWFKTLPIFVELNEFRSIHACWDDESLDAVRPYLDENNCLTDEGYRLHGEKHEPLYTALETVLKAPEAELPNGLSYDDPHGIKRTAARQMWWRDAALPPVERLDIRFNLAEGDERAVAKSALRDAFMRAAVPTFIGHYALPHEKGFEFTDTVAVLDYTAQVTAYRWEQGETAIKRSNFICSPT